MKIKDAEWTVKFKLVWNLNRYMWITIVKNPLTKEKGYGLHKTKKQALSAWKKFAKENGIRKWKLVK